MRLSYESACQIGLMIAHAFAIRYRAVANPITTPSFLLPVVDARAAFKEAKAVAKRDARVLLTDGLSSYGHSSAKRVPRRSTHLKNRDSGPSE